MAIIKNESGEPLKQQVVLRLYTLFHDVECKPLIMAVRSGRADITEILLEGGTIDLDIISNIDLANNVCMYKGT